MDIKQGDICLVNLGHVKGHEQAGLRPVLIIQNNILNKILPTTIIIPLTSNIKYKKNILHFFMNKKKTNLNKDSSLILFQIRVIDRSRIKKKISSIDKNDIEEIKQRIDNLFASF